MLISFFLFISDTYIGFCQSIQSLVLILNMALRLDTEAQWEDFLKEADIPEEATQYAKIFKDNRIKAAALPDLTDVLLKTLGITIIGDILAIIRYAKAQSQPVPTQQQAPVAQTLAPAFKAPTAGA